MYYVNSTDKEIYVSWMYQYNILSKYQSSVFKNIESYNLGMPEIFTPADQYFSISENISVKLHPDSYYLESKNFPEYSLTYNSPNSLSLKRKYTNTNLESLGALNRYFIIRKINPGWFGEFQRQIDLKKLDRLEEEWNLAQQSDSLHKGVHFQFLLPERFAPSNPEITITTDGNNYKPFPIDSTKLKQLLCTELTETNFCYYYIGYDQDSYYSKVKNKIIDIIYGFHKDQIINIKTKLLFNPLKTGRLQKVDYFNYRLCYYPAYLSTFNGNDILRINLPDEMTISKIWSYNNHIVDSSSTSLSLSSMNNLSYFNKPLIIDIVRDNFQMATWLKYVNIAFGILSLPFIFWWYLKRYFNSKLELWFNKIIGIFIGILTIETSYLMSQPDPLEYALFTNFIVLSIFLIIAIILLTLSSKNNQVKPTLL